MRYFLFSALIHIMIVIAGITLVRDTLSFDMAGDPTVTFSMVGDSSHMGGTASDMVTARNQAHEPKPEPEKPKPRPLKKRVQEKIVRKPEPEKVPEEVIEEPMVEELPVEEKDEIEKIAPLETPPVEESDTPHTEVDSTMGDPRDAGDTEDTASSTENPQNSRGEATLGEGLVQLDDGSIAARNQGIKGLSYGFISQPEPNYPNIARRMGVKDEVVIKARFLIGYDGRVEDIRFYDEVENFGFREEVEKALRGWKATPIEVDGKQVKLYFYKAFKFERLS